MTGKEKQLTTRSMQIPFIMRQPSSLNTRLKMAEQSDSNQTIVHFTLSSDFALVSVSLFFINRLKVFITC
jgi:hypothetical protein